MATAPNFLIVGAAKCGTTSLHQWLVAHPEVYLPRRKELMYFVAREYKLMLGSAPGARLARAGLITTESQYLSYFRGARGFRAVGEASPQYLYLHRVTVPRIRELLGAQTRILVVLRDPIERAVSAYRHLVRYGLETRSLADRLAFELAYAGPPRVVSEALLEAGLYHAQVRAFIDAFPRTQVVLLDDLVRAPHETMRSVLRFLGVDASIALDCERRHNVAGLPKFPRVDRVLDLAVDGLTAAEVVLRTRGLPVTLPADAVERVREALTTEAPAPSLSPAARDRLVEYYRRDVDLLAELLRRDLSHWLAPRRAA